MSTVVEQAKRAAAFQAVKDNFDPNSSYVGIGSGTTVVYVVEAIRAASTNPSVRFCPTGSQSLGVIQSAGLTPIQFAELPEGVMLDVAFDGADEADLDLNLIKGGGACLFQEKLVAERAKKWVCVADYRKAQDRLLTLWKAIPIEVVPMAAQQVLVALRELGSTKPVVRPAPGKTEPLLTDQSNYIIDAPFPNQLSLKSEPDANGAGDKWHPEILSARIKAITGVLDVGLFTGMDGPQYAAKGVKKGGQRPVACYFGMEDGTVTIRTAQK